MRDLTISTRLLPITIAYLLAVYSVDLFSHVIEIAALPIPRQIGGVSLLTWVPVMVILMLKPIINARGNSIITGNDIFFFGVMLLWAVIEWMQSLDSGYSNYTMIIATISPYLVFMAMRYHIEVFQDPNMLLDSYIVTLGSLAILHMMLLILLRVGVTPVFLNPSEITGRNGLSLALVMAVFILFFLDARQINWINWRYISFLLLAISHSILNSSRAACILLVLIVIARYLQKYIIKGRYRYATMLIFLCSGGVVAAVTFSYELMTIMHLIDTKARDDNMLSALYRMQANHLTLDMFKSSPMLGVGFDQVMQTRAGGYISHTLYLIYFASYGTVGMVPLLLTFGLMLNFSFKRMSSTSAMALFMVVVVTSFVNDPPIWFGMLAALMVASSQAGLALRGDANDRA